jgi:hypothetical protein
MRHSRNLLTACDIHARGTNLSVCGDTCSSVNFPSAIRTSEGSAALVEAVGCPFRTLHVPCFPKPLPHTIHIDFSCLCSMQAAIHTLTSACEQYPTAGQFCLEFELWICIRKMLLRISTGTLASVWIIYRVGHGLCLSNSVQLFCIFRRYIVLILTASLNKQLYI